MNFGQDTLIYIGLALFIVLIIVFIIKKAIKAIIFLFIIILAFSAYDILVRGVNPIQEYNNYKTNILYGKNIGDYTIKIKTSVQNITDTLKSGNFNTDNINRIKQENLNLHNYEAKVLPLKHTEKLNAVHNTYCGYLKELVASSDSAAQIASKGENASGNLQNINNVLNRFSTNINQVTNLKIH